MEMKYYTNILDFLNKYAGREYSPSDTLVKTEGQLAYSAAKLLGETVGNTIEGFDFIGSSKWQNSGHISRYFWLQFKRTKYRNKPFSISITTIKLNGKYCFKVYLEVSDSETNIFDKNKKDNLRDFNQAILKLAQPSVDFYYEGMTAYKRYEKILTDEQSIIKALSSGKYLKITTNIDVGISVTDTDEEILKKLLNAFYILIPYYDAIFRDVEQVTNWVIPCNIERYDVIGAFEENDRLNWHVTPQTQKMRAGDRVYIYVGKPYSRLMFECIVEETGITADDVNDEKFCKDRSWSNSCGYFRIRLLRKLYSLHLSISDLNEEGVSGSIQGPRTIDTKVKDYINSVSKSNAVLIPVEEREVLANMTEAEIEATLNAEDESSCYVYKEGLVKTRKINKEIVDKLKAHYKGQCQLCGEFVGKEFGKEIVEAHHIEYFSETQNNDSSNIIILCPNCHALIHKCDPVYNKEDYSYEFKNGKKIKISNIGHLKIRE